MPVPWRLAVSCEVAKRTMEVSFLDVIHRNQGQPLMTSRSCDGTPINVKARTSVTLPSGRVVRSSGRSSAEFLVKVQWVRCLHADGSHESAVDLQDVQSL
eukprot:5329884-Lingulodinium_polyedra.AAC.1